MTTEGNEFAERYAQLGEAELLAIARDYDNLTDSAQAALRAEFARRGMDAPLAEVEEGVEPEYRNLVTLRRYRDVSEAIVARAMLESAGIEVYLQNENLVRIDWQISNGIGGIQLQVDETNVPAALELLAQPIPRTIAFEGSEVFEQPHCPICGSIDITNQAENFEPALVAAIGFFVPLPVGPKIWICNNCSARWEDVNQSTEGA